MRIIACIPSAWASSRMHSVFLRVVPGFLPHKWSRIVLDYPFLARNFALHVELNLLIAQLKCQAVCLITMQACSFPCQKLLKAEQSRSSSAAWEEMQPGSPSCNRAFDKHSPRSRSQVFLWGWALMLLLEWLFLAKLHFGSDLNFVPVHLLTAFRYHQLTIFQ